ncbi:MAG: NUDIX domain-containing protein [Candidatus Saccharibacteria bacterium]
MAHKQAVRAIVINGDKLLAMKRDKFGMQYYTLIGGGIDVGEDAEAALRREVQEETGLTLGVVKPVFIEDGGDLYGIQYIYVCDYMGGEPQLSPSSEEAAISALGKNTYQPVWLPLNALSKVTFRSVSVRDAIMAGVSSGFPETPRTLAWKG